MTGIPIGFQLPDIGFSCHKFQREISPTARKPEQAHSPTIGPSRYNNNKRYRHHSPERVRSTSNTIASYYTRTIRKKNHGAAFFRASGKICLLVNENSSQYQWFYYSRYITNNSHPRPTKSSNDDDSTLLFGQTTPLHQCIW